MLGAFCTKKVGNCCQKRGSDIIRVRPLGYIIIYLRDFWK